MHSHWNPIEGLLKRPRPNATPDHYPNPTPPKSTPTLAVTLVLVVTLTLISGGALRCRDCRRFCAPGDRARVRGRFRVRVRVRGRFRV